MIVEEWKYSVRSGIRCGGGGSCCVFLVFSIPLLLSSMMPSEGCGELQQKWICLPKSESSTTVLLGNLLHIIFMNRSSPAKVS